MNKRKKKKVGYIDAVSVSYGRKMSYKEIRKMEKARKPDINRIKKCILIDCSIRKTPLYWVSPDLEPCCSCEKIK